MTLDETINYYDEMAKEYRANAEVEPQESEGER